MSTGQRAKSALILAAGAGVVLSACMHSSGPELMADRMWLHFHDAGAVQTSVILGDLDGARVAARRLADDSEAFGVPSGASDELDDFRASAQAVAQAESLGSAIGATSRMAASCGSCHSALSTGPVFRALPEEPELGDVGHMVQHLWAADRLWEGLVQPDWNGWEVGARVLAEHEVPVDGLPPGTSAIGRNLRALAREAMGDRTQTERAARYEDILATCASCHALATGG